MHVTKSIGMKALKGALADPLGASSTSPMPGTKPWPDTLSAVIAATEGTACAEQQLLICCSETDSLLSVSNLGAAVVLTSHRV
jgi:hypothetical protein